MSINTNAFGVEKIIQYQSQVFKLPVLNIDHFVKFEAWIEDRLWAAHRRSRKILPPDEYDANAKALLVDIGLEKFSYPQPAWWEALMTMSGLKKMVFIALSDTYTALTEEFVDQMVQDKFDEIYAEFLDQQKNPSSLMTE